MEDSMMVGQVMDDKLHEECGVFGIYSLGGANVSQDIYYGLTALQHRGQEAAGIAVSDTTALAPMPPKPRIPTIPSAISAVEYLNRRSAVLLPFCTSLIRASFISSDIFILE